MVRSRKLAFSLTSADRSRYVSSPPFIPFLLTRRFIYSYIVQFSTPHTAVAHPVLNAAIQSAYPFLSRRSRRGPQTEKAEALGPGPWTSCRSAKWEAGHRTGHTCALRDVDFGRTRDVFDERLHKHFKLAAAAAALGLPLPSPPHVPVFPLHTCTNDSVLFWFNCV